MVTAQSSVEDLQKLYEKNLQRIHDDYFTFLKFQSVSTEEKFKDQIMECANWLHKYLVDIGFDVQFWETSGHPTLFASYDGAGPDKPTLLIYNHYDVQPVDPLNEWDSPPFEPTIRNGEVYARGAQDNKGQCLYTISAIRSLFERDGKLPINVKFCIEGEEEAGSAGLLEMANKKKKELNADYLAIVDLGMKDKNTPSISLGVRGMVSMDLELIGSKTDLHSGSHGGIVYNPIHALAELLAKLRDENGRVTVPGFYDDVKEFTEEERKLIDFGFDKENYEATFGKITGGEKEFSPLESNWLRPTLEINGITGGYTGDGFKTVIPAKASAKISCRLVAGQNAQKVGAQVAKFLIDNAPEGVEVIPHVHSGCGEALRTSPHSKGVQAVSQAYGEVFQKPCVFTLEGGSIPIVQVLAAASEAEVIFMGFGLDTDQIHAPNEHFGLDRINQGFLTIGRILEILAQ